MRSNYSRLKCSIAPYPTPTKTSAGAVALFHQREGQVGRVAEVGHDADAARTLESVEDRADEFLVATAVNSDLGIGGWGALAREDVGGGTNEGVFGCSSASARCQDAPIHIPIQQPAHARESSVLRESILEKVKLRKIFIVDDEEAIVLITKRHLERAGYDNCIYMTDATKVIDISIQQAPDLMGLVFKRMVRLAGRRTSLLAVESKETRV